MPDLNQMHLNTWFKSNVIKHFTWIEIALKAYMNLQFYKLKTQSRLSCAIMYCYTHLISTSYLFYKCMASKHFTTWVWILSAVRSAGLFCELTWGGVERSLWWAGWGRGWQAWPIVWSSWALSTYFVLLACLRASACQEPGIKFSPRRNLQNLFRILCMTVCSVDPWSQTIIGELALSTCARPLCWNVTFNGR